MKSFLTAVTLAPLLAFGVAGAQSPMTEFEVRALLDSDPGTVGRFVAGLQVEHIDDLEELVRSRGIAIAVIATPAGVAQSVCDRLVAAGVGSILNFAPAVLVVPEHVEVRKVDMSIELQILAFHEQRKTALDPLTAMAGVDAGPDPRVAVTS